LEFIQEINCQAPPFDPGLVKKHQNDPDFSQSWPSLMHFDNEKHKAKLKKEN